MVIYLLVKRRLLFSYLLFILCVISIGYISKYLRYNDYDISNYQLLIEENRILKRELYDLNNMNIEYDDYILGRVLYRDMYSFYEEIIINLGEENVEVGDALVVGNGLVGVIYKVNKTNSYAKLLSSDYNVSVLVNGEYGNLNNGIISLLDKYSDIKEGDYVYTSNYGDVESGIYVGRIKEIFYDKDILGKQAVVELVDNNDLNYVGVIKKIK